MVESVRNRATSKRGNLGMPLSRMKADDCAGVHELRIKHEKDTTVRILLLRAQGGCDRGFPCIQKKSQKTLFSEINLGRQRLQEVLKEAELNLDKPIEMTRTLRKQLGRALRISR